MMYFNFRPRTETFETAFSKQSQVRLFTYHTKDTLILIAEAIRSTEAVKQ